MSHLQIRRILKLMMEGCSQREIHRSTGIHRVTLKNYLHRFKSSGKTFSELFALSDHDLSVLVHPPRSTKDSGERYADLSTQLKRLSEELGKKNSHVTSRCSGRSIFRIALSGISIPSFAIISTSTCSSMMPPCRSSTSQGISCRSTLPAPHSGSSTRSPDHDLSVPFWSAPCPAAASFMLNHSHQPGRNI